MQMLADRDSGCQKSTVKNPLASLAPAHWAPVIPYMNLTIKNLPTDIHARLKHLAQRQTPKETDCQA